MVLETVAAGFAVVDEVDPVSRSLGLLDFGALPLILFTQEMIQLPALGPTVGKKVCRNIQITTNKAHAAKKYSNDSSIVCVAPRIISTIARRFISSRPGLIVTAIVVEVKLVAKIL